MFVRGEASVLPVLLLCSRDDGGCVELMEVVTKDDRFGTPSPLSPGRALFLRRVLSFVVIRVPKEVSLDGRYRGRPLLK